MTGRVMGLAGLSNSGKTTLMKGLVSRFEQKGYKVAVIKHDAHGHYEEAPGKDSTELMGAGAAAAITISPDAVRMYERKRVTLREMIAQLQPQYDLILIEGFKREAHPKLALFRTPEQAVVLEQLDPPPLAWITDHPEWAAGRPEVPVLSPSALEEIVCFIEGISGYAKL